MTIDIKTWAELGEAERSAVLARPQHVSSGRQLRQTVEDIIRSVRDGGDGALVELEKRYGRADLCNFEVTDREFEQAEAELAAGQRDAIDVAIANVSRFHEAQWPAPVSVETAPGIHCRRISHPIDAVGLYVPAGTAPLPSTAVMLAVPAAIAGCPEIVMCTPPRPDGTADPAVLLAARRAGARRVFKIGGAQAIAAMAFGTDSVPAVDKIFGPGNAYVTEAKTQVSVMAGGAAIDMPAGPSEVLVIADGAADPEFVAADLLSQAEHGVDSQVVLVTDNRALADAVRREIEEQLDGLSRRDIARQSMAASRIIVTDGLATAVSISNRYAPEHLILQVADPESLLDSIRNAGSVFLGAWSPESVGDYCSGTNHVLPTYGYAKTYSGLSVDHFVRHMTIQELSEDGLRGIGDTVVTLAGLEGLDAHAAAVQRRLARLEQDR